MSQQGTTSNASRSWLVCEQPRLHLGGLMLLLVLVSLTPVLGFDMYTPAIPTMADALSTTDDMVNLTLLLFFAANAVGLLLFGTISDKYGRRPVLMAGCIVFAVGNLLCACSLNIGMLICSRIIAALGGGAATAVGTAVIKDAIAADYREKMLSVVQVISVVGPVVAPVLGAVLLQFFSWRSAFVAITSVGVVMVVLALLFVETLPSGERTTDKIVATMGHLVDVCRHKGFTMFLIIVSMPEIPFMAYIALASYIYEEFFGLGPMGYSVFFAVCAFATAFSPFIWLVAKRWVRASRFVSTVLPVCLLVGVLLTLFGHVSPFVFCILFILFALEDGCVRPLSTNILLNQRDDDTGAAASVINFVHSIIGCLGMVLVMLPWQSDIVCIGVIIIASLAVTIALWVYMLKKPVRVKDLID